MIARAWAEFERALSWHLHAEERYLLPLAEAALPAEVRAAREEHALLREYTTELELRVELDTLRAPAVDELARRLREHAARECAKLYDFVDGSASASDRHLLDALLGLAARRMFRGAPWRRGTPCTRSAVDD